MKENYAPWNIDVNTFPREGSLQEQSKFLICFAILAPSGHNSQPWEFSIGNNSIGVFINRGRSLAQSDPEQRQLLISIGCAIENILVAADYYCFRPSVSYFPDARNNDLVARIDFKERSSVNNSKNHLIFSIPRRRTNRGKYRDDSLPEDFLKDISDLSNSDFQISIITDKEKKNALADIAVAAQIEAMDSDSFREELSHYVKSNFTRSNTGMPGFTLGMPAPISLFASRLIKRVNMSRKTKKQDVALLKQYTPAFVVISTRQDDKINRVRAGQLFERIWIMAEKRNISCAPLAAPVQVNNHYKVVQDVLVSGLRPLIFFRLGYGIRTLKHSPRLSLADVLQSSR